MTTLVELRVVDVDADDAVRSVFVVCMREREEGVNEDHLVVAVVDGLSVWQTHVKASDKPMVLDCAGAEYVAVLERAFTSGHVDDDAAEPTTVKNMKNVRPFTFKWSSRRTQTLTLMEETKSTHKQSSIAMKYTELAFKNGTEKQWTAMMHAMARSNAQRARAMQDQDARIQELQGLMARKDTLLDKALDSKQQLENQLMRNFCAVLNAKKQEIQRLHQEIGSLKLQQRALEFSSPVTSQEATPVKRKRGRVPPVAKTTRGARLRRKLIADEDEEYDEDEEEAKKVDNDEDDESDGDRAGTADDDSDSNDDEEEKSPNKRKRGALDAYKKAPTGPSQICSVDDVLNDLDDLVKSEVEANEAAAEAHSPIANNSPDLADHRPKRARPPRGSTTSRSQSAAAKRPVKKKSPDKPPRGTPTPPLPPTRATRQPKRAVASPPPAINSEEEDILDMLA